MFKKLDFSKRLLLSILSIVFISSFVSTYLIEEKIFSSTQDISQKYIQSLTFTNTFKAKEDLNKSVVLSYSFASSLSTFINKEQTYTKENIISIMTSLLKSNPYILGIWLEIDANILFPNQKSLAKKNGHDSDGRFVPYLVRSDNSIVLEHSYVQSYPSRPWVDKSRVSGKEYITEPYISPINGKKVLVAAISVPVYKNNQFIGTVGINISLDSITKTISKINVYKSGYAFLTTSTGIFISHPNKEFLGKDISKVINDDNYSSKLSSKIRNDEKFEYEKKSYGTSKMSYYYTLPFEIAKTGVNWGLTVSVPEEEYLKDAIFIKWFAIITGIISFLIISFVLVYNTRILEKNLNLISNGLNSFFTYLNKDSLNSEKIKIDSNDEFGKMAYLINTNVKNIQESLEKDIEDVSEVINIVKNVENGYLKNVISKKASNPELILLCDNFNNMINTLKNNIGKDLNKINIVLDNFSNHNFTANIENPEGKIEISINNLGKEISSLLLKSLNTGLTLEDASKKLITNVDTLNSSSNEAAASLEETAAALEEITSTIISNTENIDNMTISSDSLTLSAKDGLNLAEETSSAMDNITDQVTLITEAISVIDKIAFQTNILSLNAAVEASTAGEAGKGFAVVAQEVRNLASRSAEAAKEIKDLVQNATAKASYGKNISAEMISGYQDLLKDVNSVDEMIKNISASSKEQESGITQINDAITNLDRQTQENANIASQTYSIANQTDELAKQIVEDSQSKEFFGK
ncbi:MAG: methyl-accepting chemotaxis protein [Campylobacteraceae bacterium]|nr:methyl-accepting chemotaxis protein [Campylobacteraceae bacterium]